MRNAGRSGSLVAVLVCCLAFGSGGGLARASGAALPEQDSDLQAVKRAVAQEPAASVTPPPTPRAERAEPRRERRDDGRWLRVRVDEKGGRKRVSINLPLAFVRAFDDVPIRYDCGDQSHRRCTLRLAEILSALDQGEDLVQIDDDDTKVRVWIE
jgi:hypothetical protein